MQKAQIVSSPRRRRTSRSTTLLEQPRVEVEAKGPARGPENAPVTIVEFSDFQCPFCSRAPPTRDQVMEKYGDKVRLVFRHFPLRSTRTRRRPPRPRCAPTTRASSGSSTTRSSPNQQKLAVAELKEKATRLGLDAAQVRRVPRLRQARRDGARPTWRDGDAAGVNGTPAFFVNGVPLGRAAVRGHRRADRRRDQARASAIQGRPPLQALILAGGSGARFLAGVAPPPSQAAPSLLGGRSLLRMSLDRLLPVLSPRASGSAPRATGEAVRHELPEVPPEQVLLEPVGATPRRNGWSLAEHAGSEAS